MEFRIDLPMPLWVSVTGPPVLYGIVLLLFLRRWSVRSLVVGTALLSGVHVAVGVAAGLVYAALKPSPISRGLADALSEFFVSPGLQLAWLPLMVIPVAWVLRRPPRLRARRRPPKGLRPTPKRPPAPVLRPVLASADPSSRVDPGRMASRPAAVATGGHRFLEGRAAALSIAEVIPSTFESPVMTAASVALESPGIEEMDFEAPMPLPTMSVPRATDDVRIPFDRLRGQLPAGAFTWSLDAVALALETPHHITVPREVVVPQLEEGRVAVAWSKVANQFPRNALALADAEIAAQLPAGGLVLPLDEVVRQLPAAVFDLAASSVMDSRDFESFPEPFRRGEPVFTDAASRELATDGATPISPDNAAPSPHGVAASSDDDVASFTTAAVAGADAQPPPAPVAMVDVAAETPAHRAGSPGTERQHAARPDDNLGQQSLDFSAAAVGSAAPVTALRSTPAPAPEDPTLMLEGRRLALSFDSVVPFELGVQQTDGRPIFTLAGGSVEPDVLVATARRLAPVLAGAAALGRVEHVVLSQPDGAVVVAALGGDAAAPILAAAVRKPGAVALLELLVRRACRASWTPIAQSEAPVTVAAAAPLRRMPGSARVARIAAALGAREPLAAAVFVGVAGVTIFTFVPPETSAEAVAAAALALHEAARAGGADSESMALATSKGTVLVRTMPSASGGVSLVALVGRDSARRGRQNRDLARAARRLAGA